MELNFLHKASKLLFSCDFIIVISYAILPTCSN